MSCGFGGEGVDFRQCLKFAMKHNSPINRRRFLQRTASLAGMAAGAQYLGMPALLAGSPNSKLGVAVIGADGMGGYSFDCAMKERFVAVCDVDDNKLAHKLKEFGDKVKDRPAPKAYYDYRKMLEECQHDLNVVLIATPDHHHAPAAIRAIHLGKAVFSQKPLAHNIAECYALAKAARDKKVLTQMGNQGHCGDTIRKACEYIWAGAVGNITETHSLLGRNFGGAGGRPPASRSRRDCIGTNGSGRRRTAIIMKTCIRLIGAIGVTLAPAPSATWPATTWTRSSGRSRSARPSLSP